MRSILVVFASLGLLACTPNQAEQPKQAEQPNQAEPPKQAEPPAQPDAPPPIFVPDPGKPDATSGVKLSSLEPRVTVPVGTKLLYSFESHASVGYGATQRVDDPAVVKYLRTDVQYERSAEERKNEDGADGATGTFVFEAVGVGTTKLTVDKLFRGDVEESTTFTITVTQTR